VILVNFKRYPQAAGENAVKLASICQKLTQEFGFPIIPIPDAPDISLCTKMGIECWTQKFEPNLTQQTGTLLNHSDFRLSRPILKEELYLSITRGDKVCVCSETFEETVELLQNQPHFLAYEPPELIGSKSTSVAEAQPEVIGKAAAECKRAGTPFMVGAGIKSKQDVVTSIKQGAMGILVASAVVEAADQEQKLRELANAFSMKS
jgi:triosephosphate isomerase